MVDRPNNGLGEWYAARNFSRPGCDFSGEAFALRVDVFNVCYLFVAKSLSFQAKVAQTLTDKERIILTKP